MHSPSSHTSATTTNSELLKELQVILNMGNHHRFPVFVFFGHCCARHNDCGSHADMLNWSSVDNSIAQIGQ